MKNKPYTRDGRSPEPKSEQVSRTMSLIRGKDTGPEKRIRALLTELGYRGYRLNYAKVEGRPDICFTRKKVAIFVHGCYWHRCPKCDNPLPKHNRPFWRKKFAANVERDGRKLTALKKNGWKTLVIWECDIKKKKDDLITKRLIKILS